MTDTPNRLNLMETGYLTATPAALTDRTSLSSQAGSVEVITFYLEWEVSLL